MILWHKDFLERVKKSIAAANEELGLASWLSDGGKNGGIRAIWGKRASWLSDVLHAAREQVKQQEHVGNWIPCVKDNDVWFFCSCCGFVMANSNYAADYEELGIDSASLNADKVWDHCPHCGQFQRKHFNPEEIDSLRNKWENGEL